VGNRLQRFQTLIWKSEDGEFVPDYRTGPAVENLPWSAVLMVWFPHFYGGQIGGSIMVQGINTLKSNTAEMAISWYGFSGH